VRRSLVAACATALLAAPVFPCGGPGADVVDLPLVPTTTYLVHTLYDDEYEVELRPELRLLEPLHAVMPDSVGRVYEFLYESGGYAPDPAFDSVGARRVAEMRETMWGAMQRGAYRDATASAQAAVREILDVPAAFAAVYADALRDAVEIIEVVPRLTPADREPAARYFSGDTAARRAVAVTASLPPALRDAFEVRRLSRDRMAAYADAHPESPRVPSLRFVAIQESMRTGIPDGWAPIDSVAPARWAQLERLHNEWLRQFPDHPLADYVRLSKVRLFYLKGDGASAWDELLAIYPRHRERVLGEMAYLVRKSAYPASLDDPRIDWPLRAALLSKVDVSAQRWSKYWEASHAHMSEAWALPMQERLLWRAIEMQQQRGALPPGFPSRPQAPSGLWGKLRLIALLDAGDIAGAFAQADSVNGDESDVTAIRVRLHLIRRDWGAALAASPNGDPATAYLVRVLAPPRIVDSVAAAPRSPLVVDARLTVAGRRASAGDWAGASRAAAGTGATRARLWARTVALAADTSRAGRLAFARWMRDRTGQLFFGENTFWLRGLNWRLDAIASDTSDHSAPPPLDPRLPWTVSEERARVAAHLQSTTELYYALWAYARWLDDATARTPGLAAVVREADQVYNRLINWDANNSRFWKGALASSPEARSIRRAGALLRRPR